MKIEHVRHLAVALRLRYLYIILSNGYSVGESLLACQFLLLLGYLLRYRIFIQTVKSYRSVEKRVHRRAEEVFSHHGLG